MNNDHARRWGLCGAAIFLALLTGCGTQMFERRPDRSGESAPERREGAPEPTTAPVNLTGYSPSFKQGYSDGCDSAGSRGQRRNESRYKTEADYMMGWNDGFSVCQRRR